MSVSGAGIFAAGVSLLRTAALACCFTLSAHALESSGPVETPPPVEIPDPITTGTLLPPNAPSDVTSPGPLEEEHEALPSSTTGALRLPEANAALLSLLEARAETKGAMARAEREAIAAFYRSRDFAPLWFSEGRPNEEVAPVIARLEKAQEDGLDLSRFPIPALEAKTPRDLAAADLALSDAVVAYGRQATGSRVNPSAISRLIGARPEVADPALILANVAKSGSMAGDALWDYNPRHAGYQALREKLGHLPQRRNPGVQETRIPAGPVLRVGMRDPRVPLIRARLSLDGDSAEESAGRLYDTRIAAAVKDFQKAIGLPASGILTARTIAAMSGGQPSNIEAEILANMERWRWMPRDLGTTRIEVNIPAFEAVVIENGEVMQRHRVIVGKTETPTPIFSNTMQYLIVNPYWTVPRSILRNELSSDPNHLRRLGYQVTSRNGQMMVRQPPGERNALGRIKFMFPNDYAVYLHDTPKRTLFNETKRAFSHGCVRLDEPFRFAETVLGEAWTEKRIKKLLGGKERYVNLPKPLPVHIGYFTAFVDESGFLQTREDLYGFSRRVRVALGLEK